MDSPTGTGSTGQVRSVLYVLERYPELSQTFVAREIEGLQGAGVRVEVAALERGTGGSLPTGVSWPSDAGTADRIASALRMGFSAPAACRRQLTSEANWPPPHGSRRTRGLLRIAPWFTRATSVDHIHAHFATEAADIARLLSAASGTPWSFTAHGADAYSDPAALAVNLGSAAFARACSGHVAAQLRAAGAGGDCRVIEIPVAVDVKRFADASGPASNGPIVAVGRLIEKKGFDDLIEAVSACRGELAGRELLIAGEGPLRADLERLIAATGAPVRLLGTVGNDHLPALMSSASLFALTPRTASNGDRDGRPAAIVEAMAAGLPILSTTQPGIPELVDSRCGLLAAPGDRQGIANALRNLLALPTGGLQAMGKAGRDHVMQDYSPSAVASQLIAEMSAR